ncbi:hypothetical protein CI088_07955 [Enterococcus plantarum]|uniref:Suppressor of fused-like domain-containing protein n=1 Tax=Enterococcus plantarum TaxID=1077675 RepID=A0A2W4BMB5_9ENTE|nr:suppressor of fused domain protein [Enterococcus plantarum]PZL73779.1 hypothetical protein CI088_07955 [Enterococcus plantarum]
MNNDKLIAQRILQAVGGNPKVVEYRDKNENSTVGIFIGANRPYDDVTTYSTIGLSNYGIGLKYQNKEIRVEFVGGSESKYKKFGNILSSCAFNIINDKFSCKPGTVYPNTVSEYYEEISVKHVLFTDPFLWDGLEYIDTENVHITWLMLIPISDKEFKFIRNNSVEELEDLFKKNEIDIFDLNRDSVI